MVLSNLDIFSDDQAITATADSTNYVDTGKHAGKGEPIDILIRVTEDFNNLTDLTVTIKECDTTGGSYTTVLTLPAVLLAALVEGAEFAIRYLPKTTYTDRYVKIGYAVNGSAPTTGKMHASLEPGEDFPYREGLYLKPRNPTGLAATA